MKDINSTIIIGYINALRILTYLHFKMHGKMNSQYENCTEKKSNQGIHSDFISSLDVRCSTWPAAPQVQAHGCGQTGSGPNDWKVLDRGMTSSDSAGCERLCKNIRESGCCFLQTGVGCNWRPSSYSKPITDDIAISIDCHRSGRRNSKAFGNKICS